MDNPTLIAACVVGDGEAETGPLATAWHSNKFLNPVTDGAVLPILHLNGYKISSPTLFSRITSEEVEDFFQGSAARTPRFVEGDEPAQMHQKMAAALDWAVREIQRIQQGAREFGDDRPPPLAHARVPLSQGLDLSEGGGRRAHRGHLPRSPAPGGGGRRPSGAPGGIGGAGCAATGRRSSLMPRTRRCLPFGPWPPRGSAAWAPTPTPTAACCCGICAPPTSRDYAVEVPAPGAAVAEDMAVLGKLRPGRDQAQPERPGNFRIFAPDEAACATSSPPAFEASGRRWTARATTPRDEGLVRRRAGYGLHALRAHAARAGWRATCSPGGTASLNSYEAFIRIVDSMVEPARQVAQGVPGSCPGGRTSPP